MEKKNELKKVPMTALKATLSAQDYELMRRSVVLRCMITSAAWSQWISGKYKPETKYQPIIDEIAAQFGITIFGTEGGQQ